LAIGKDYFYSLSCKISSPGIPVCLRYHIFSIQDQNPFPISKPRVHLPAHTNEKKKGKGKKENSEPRTTQSIYPHTQMKKRKEKGRKKIQSQELHSPKASAYRIVEKHQKQGRELNKTIFSDDIYTCIKILLHVSQGPKSQEPSSTITFNWTKQNKNMILEEKHDKPNKQMTQADLKLGFVLQQWLVSG
jgi:hypothetical protein